MALQREAVGTLNLPSLIDALPPPIHLHVGKKSDVIPSENMFIFPPFFGKMQFGPWNVMSAAKRAPPRHVINSTVHSQNLKRNVASCKKVAWGQEASFMTYQASIVQVCYIALHIRRPISLHVK